MKTTLPPSYGTAPENAVHKDMFAVKHAVIGAKDTLKKQPKNGLFRIQTAAKFIADAKSQPNPKMLFSEFWHEGEVCILYADTNVGKSILAVQIAETIASGKPFPGFKFTAKPQKVLYFDFELSQKQFQSRYTKDYEEEYLFSPNFLRAELDPDLELPDGISFDDYLPTAFEKAIMETSARVLIVDNLTYLRSETEKAQDAISLMKHLKRLKKEYNLSILVLAHTPKRDASTPISLNNLAGSRHLANFCDSAFSIGASAQGKQVRYIKQMKERETEKLYGSENVVVCEIEKPMSFLRFSFKGYGKEWEHLRHPEEVKKQREDRNAKIKELAAAGRSQRQIADEVGIAPSMVNKILNPK
jgi:KaiC/GvpD/RAD55 family RecA-like ATPase